VQSVNTVIFIPSSFDFVRIRNYFKKNGHVTFSTLSECVSKLTLNFPVRQTLFTTRESSNQDISRARQAFFSGKDAFLLVSERYHFYRRSVIFVFPFCSSTHETRYKLRGVRNIIFYALPDHPQFYTEFLSYPFLDQKVESTDVTCRALISKWDWFRLERIVGTKKAVELLER
jgi:U3 small nucleolar RNA-associated protein 25